MSQPAAEARRQQQRDALAGAALRALAGDGQLAVRGQIGWRGALPLPWPAPHLLPVEGETPPIARARADALALREAAAHPAHAAHAPDAQAEPLARRLYEWLWQLHAESQVPPHWPGAHANVAARFAQWAQAAVQAPPADSVLGQLLLAVAVSAWRGLTRGAVPEPVQDALEATRAGLAPQLGHALHALTRARGDAARFAPAAAALALAVAALADAAEARAGPPATRRQREGLALWDAAPVGPDAGLPEAASGASRAWAAQAGRYRVFTRAFDVEWRPATQVRPALLADYRQRLDARLHALAPPVARLGRELAAVLARPERDGWRFERQQGRIDARLLPRVVSSPAERRVFKEEARLPRVDAALALLIDCSGSMRAHADGVALWADIWCRMAAVAQLPIEVLGFSTASWQGGRAARAWRRAGRPAQPGRVAERLHAIYKSAREPYAHSRRALSALLKSDHYREGLDGEAVAWAGARLAHQGAARRVLLVVSDGCPMESATQQANDAHYLDAHLRAVVAAEQARGTRVVGIGLGLDLAPFYPLRVALAPDELLRPAAFRQTLARLR